jgi:hypothetical protein
MHANAVFESPMSAGGRIATAEPDASATDVDCEEGVTAVNAKIWHLKELDCDLVLVGSGLNASR